VSIYLNTNTGCTDAILRARSSYSCERLVQSLLCDVAVRAVKSVCDIPSRILLLHSTRTYMIQFKECKTIHPLSKHITGGGTAMFVTITNQLCHLMFVHNHSFNDYFLCYMVVQCSASTVRNQRPTACAMVQR
jgi:hypothetical protein